MKKPSGPLLYIGQPHLQPVQPVMQKTVKASDDSDLFIEPESSEAEQEEKGENTSEAGRLKPFREMNTTEKVIYLARRRIPVPCRFEWREGSARGKIEKFDDEHIWITDEKDGVLVQIAIADILHIRLAGT